LRALQRLDLTLLIHGQNYGEGVTL
jgi:hypothetical protein